MRLGSLIVGFYAWLFTLFGGMVLLDVVYARLAPEGASALSAAADLLLWVGFLAILSALAAIAFAWQVKAARNLMIASLLVLALEFLLPVLLAPILQGNPGFAPGPWLRVLICGTASILAFIGMRRCDGHN